MMPINDKIMSEIISLRQTNNTDKAEQKDKKEFKSE